MLMREESLQNNDLKQYLNIYYFSFFTKFTMDIPPQYIVRSRVFSRFLRHRQGLYFVQMITVVYLQKDSVK